MTGASSGASAIAGQAAMAMDAPIALLAAFVAEPMPTFAACIYALS